MPNIAEIISTHNKARLASSNTDKQIGEQQEQMQPQTNRQLPTRWKLPEEIHSVPGQQAVAKALTLDSLPTLLRLV